jgi:hypothetical protein
MSSTNKTTHSGIVAAERLRLKESVVKEALEHLDWDRLKKHLDDAGLDEGALECLLGHFRRTTSLIMPYPNEKREARRAKFVGSLDEYVRLTLGSKASASVSEEVALLDRIERGYRGILEILHQCDIARLPSDVRAAAYISRAAHQYAYAIRQFHETLKARREIALPWGALLMTEDMVPVSPDGVITALVKSVTITLVMEAHKNEWLDAGDFVILPPLPAIGDDERLKAGSTEMLAMCWRQWRRTEERRRFLGGAFEEHAAPNLPAWVPNGAQHVTVYHPRVDEVFDYVANERLNDRLAQTFMEMLIETNMEAKTIGIRKGAPLLPHAFVSAEEAHAAVSLSEILSYNIADDQERPAGMRLVEWLRGYAVLKQLAEERNSKGSDVADLTFAISREELLALLEKCGLNEGTASIFVDAATLKRSSRDLFDSPLIKMADGSLMVFSPGLITANTAGVVLSTIANLGEPLSRKGKAFEQDILSFFKDRKLQAESFKVSLYGEEYEYDVILSWGDYLFVFECKNYNLSGNHPVQAFYFELEMRSSGKQVKRLAEGLRRSPDILSRRLGVDVATKKIVPCVLNALPFSLPGEVDGVYFTDASALKRFFRERYFHIKTPYRIDENLQILHRTAMHSSWAGDEPSPEDLIRQLEDPFQLRLMLAHTEIGGRPFVAGSADIVVAEDFFRTEMTIESYSDLVGVSADLIRKERAEIARHVKRLKSNVKRKRPLKRRRNRRT